MRVRAMWQNRLQRLLIAMRCRWFFHNSDAMSMFLSISYHRNRCDYFCSTIGTDCFPMFFQFQNQCLGMTFCGKPKNNGLYNSFFQFFYILLGFTLILNQKELYILHKYINIEVEAEKLVNMRPQMVQAEASLSRAFTTTSSS